MQAYLELGLGVVQSLVDGPASGEGMAKAGMMRSPFQVAVGLLLRHEE